MPPSAPGASGAAPDDVAEAAGAEESVDAPDSTLDDAQDSEEDLADG